MTKERFIEIAKEEGFAMDTSYLDRLWESRPDEVDLMTDEQVMIGMRLVLKVFAIHLAHMKAGMN